MVPETFKMDQEAFKEHLEQLAVWEELKKELSLTESVQGAEEFVKALFLQVRAYQESGLPGITFYLLLWYQFWRFRFRNFWWQNSGSLGKKDE